MKIYQVSGLGANQNAFKYLKFDAEHEVIYLPWLQPESHETLEHYAQRMSENIQTDEDFILMGLSFGGLVVQEMNRFLDPKLNVLISTVKSRSELPSFMRLSATTRAHKLIPPSFLSSDKGLSYAFFRKLYSSKMPDLQEFFDYRDPEYLTWSIDQIVNWKNHVDLKPFVHIHGDKDIVFPISNIQDAIKIEGGNHLMVLHKARKISEIINERILSI
ncbi:alpha/beta hydrolase [Moheibacter stercoris]|uniref:Pimeloyl-ACP methyl ester carboxylesterase n=1 Tax=Moheibacter stercoris TaxID=1628251 RepID=A0ABV2LUV1_9FLAO